MRLASDASKVKLLVGESIGTVVSVSTMLVAGLTIGMTYCWQEARTTHPPSISLARARACSYTHFTFDADN
jgi:hypothetical protein